MMTDWNDYMAQIGSRVGEFAKLAPATVKGFGALDHAAEQGGRSVAPRRAS